MLADSQQIHVVSAADRNYVPHLAAMLQSLFRNEPGASITFHLLHRPDLDRECLERVRALCRGHGAACVDVTVPSGRVAEFLNGTRYPEEAWYRIVLPSVLPDLDRVLWLDADVLVLQSIRPLWDQDLCSSPLAAARNALGPLYRDHPRALGIADGRWRYFNTGVMLLDLRQMRASQAEDRLRKAAAKLRAISRFADQDVFSAVFADTFAELPLSWNVTAGSYIYAAANVRVHGFREYLRAMSAPKIVHFTLHKPWLYGSSHPYRDQYLEQRRAAGWPPPAHDEDTWKQRLLRRVPMLWRALLATPRLLTAADILMAFGVWLTHPTVFIQRRR